MFRYERPQKGRLRQFVQIGIESIGNQGPLEDAEVIACGASLLKRLGLESDCVLNINSLGDASPRELIFKTQSLSRPSLFNKLAPQAITSASSKGP